MPTDELAAGPLPGIRSEGLFLAAIFAGVFLIYLATMPRTVTLEDSGEFIRIAASAGIAHPPGYPTYALLGKLFTLLPVGSIATRVHLLSAVSGAAACAALYLCVQLAVRRRVAALLAAGLLAGSATFWSQSIVAEVYALHALFVFGLLASCLRLNLRYDDRGMRWTALLYGLALTNHWPLAVLASGSFAILLAPHARRIARQAPILLALVCLGLTPYLHLLLRSQITPVVSAWGPIESAGEWLAYIARSRYGDLEYAGTASLGDRLAFLGFFARATVVEFTRPLFALVPLGLLAAWRRLHGAQRLALLWALLSSSALLLVGLRWEFDAIHRELYRVYQLVPFGIAAFLAGCSVLWIADCRALSAQWRSRSAAAFAFVAVMGVFLGNFAQNDLREETLARDYAHAVLESLPREAVLVVNADFDAGPIAYAQAIDGLRPDVTVYSRSGYLFQNRLADSTRAGWERRADAQQAELIEEHGRVFDTEFGHSGLVEQIFGPTGVMGVRSSYRVVDHGLTYQLSRPEDPPRATRAEPPADATSVARAEAALEAERAGHYSNQWRYLKEIVMGKFCRTLALADRTTLLETSEIAPCQRSLALIHAGRGEYGRAAELLGAILDSDYRPPRKRRAGLYNEYFLLRLNELGVDALSERRPGSGADVYQQLVDRVLVGAHIYPGCDSGLVGNLLTLAGMTPIALPFPELRQRFAHCPELLGRLDALSRRARP